MPEQSVRADTGRSEILLCRLLDLGKGRPIV